MNIILIILAIIALPFIIALFTKKEYVVHRETVINRPRQEVFDYIRHLKNQDNYSKWNTLDPHAKKGYSGTDGAVGFIASWDSDNKKVGKGEQEIVNIVEGEKIDVKLHFIKPFEGTGLSTMSTEAVTPGHTRVRWHMTGRMNYPTNFMLLIMNMDKMLGADLHTNLSNLKKVLEQPAYAAH